MNILTVPENQSSGKSYTRTKKKKVPRWQIDAFLFIDVILFLFLWKNRRKLILS